MPPSRACHAPAVAIPAPVSRAARLALLLVPLTAGVVTACTPEPGPAATGSRSALLSSRSGEVAREADRVAEHAAAIEGMIDEWRAAPPEQRAEIAARIQAEARRMQDEAHDVQAQVRGIEDGAHVWGEPR